MPKPEIVLPADVYDTLELCTHAYGGIGAHCFEVVTKNGEPVPWCIYGHASFATNTEAGGLYFNEVSRALDRAGLSVARSDRAVRELEPCNAERRVSWRAYCKYLNIVRGAS